MQIRLLPQAILAQSSNIEQPTHLNADRLPAMAREIHIVQVEKDGEDGLIATFSDGTTGAYVVEELLELRPIRENVARLKARTAAEQLTAHV